ncbi:MAG: acyltransferase domain-containing protein [Chloroflexota bacterium]
MLTRGQGVPDVTPASAGLWPIVASAKTEPALIDAAFALASAVETAPDAKLYNLAYTGTFRRGRHAHRLAVVGRSREELAAGLRSAGGPPRPGAALAEGASRGQIAFAYSGNGSQWAGMGMDLLAGDPPFRDAVEEFDALFAQRAGWSVIDERRRRVWIVRSVRSRRCWQCSWGLRRHWRRAAFGRGSYSATAWAR